MIELRSTRGFHVDGVKVLVYGGSGAGKTTLIKTLPSPVVLSAEGGLLALKNEDLPFIQISTMDDLNEAYSWAATSDEARQFDSVALDSITEIADVCLQAEKARNKDGRAAYGEMADRMAEMIRRFRDLPGKHVYFSAQAEKAQDDMGKILWGPGMPGAKLAQRLPFFFDEVLALHVQRDAAGNLFRVLQTQADDRWTAKDRSGELDAWEYPDLGAVIAKIQGGAA